MAEKKSTKGEQAHEAWWHQAFHDMKIPGVNAEDFFASHNKNMSTFSQIQKLNMELVRDLSTLQAHYFRYAFEEAGQGMQGKAPLNRPFVKIDQDKQKQLLERTFEHYKKVSDMIHETQAEVCDLCRERCAESTDEVYAHFKNQAGPASF